MSKDIKPSSSRPHIFCPKGILILFTGILYEIDLKSVVLLGAGNFSILNYSKVRSINCPLNA